MSSPLSKNRTKSKTRDEQTVYPITQLRFNSRPRNSISDTSFENLQGKEDEPERGNWDNKLEYLLSSIGYAVGLGNVWRFPYLCYRNGGGAFLFPYLLVLALCGLPIFLLESSLGQFSSQGPVRAFNGVPMWKGLGFAMLAVSSFVAPYYNIILSWGIYYLWESVKALWTGELPWKNCVENDDRYENCFSRDEAKACKNNIENGTKLEGKCETHYFQRQTASEIYYERVVLGLDGRPAFNKTLYDLAVENDAKDSSDPNKLPFIEGEKIDLSYLGGIQWHLALTLLISWVFIGFSIIKGVKSSGKTMYVTATLPYAVLTLLLVKGLTLPGAGQGILFFIKPEMGKIFEPSIWKDAVTQIFYSLSVSWGGLLTLSSYNPFRNNVYRDTYIVVCANSATSIFAGFAIFSYLGFMANQLGLEVSDVVSSGPGLAFTVWPEAMTNLSSSSWVCACFSILFFMMLYSLGISTMIVTVETICTSFLDIFPTYRKKRWIVVASVISVLYAVGLPLVTVKGAYWFQVFDDYAASYSLVISAILEMLVMSHVYGIDRVANDIKMMTGRGLPGVFRFLWGYVTPSILTITLVFNIIAHKPSNAKYTKIVHFFPSQTYYLSAFLVFTPIFIMIFLAIRELMLKNWNVKQAQAPTRHWGPLKDADRTQYGEEREDGVVYSQHADIEESKKLCA